MSDVNRRATDLIRERLPVNRKLIAWSGVLIDWQYLENAIGLPQHVYIQLIDVMNSKLRDEYGDSAPDLTASGVEIDYLVVVDQLQEERMMSAEDVPLNPDSIAYMVAYAHRARGWDPSFVPR